MPQYNNQDENHVMKDAMDSKENDRYFNPLKSISPYRIYQATSIVASTAQALVQDAPRAILGGIVTITSSVARYFFKKTRQKFQSPLEKELQ